MSLIKSQGAGDVSSGLYSHTIDQSLRFEDGEANYLSRTQGSPTLEKKYTISAWIKLANISATTRMIIGGYDNSTGQFPFYLRSDHKLGFYDSDGVSSYYVLYGTSVLRDPSAWYHVVLNFDSANSTAAYRVRIYINGEEETMTGYGVPSSSTLPLNRPGYANQSGTILQVGASNNNTSNPFDGYMAEVHFIDGSVLAPTEFGETVNGIWIPKDTSGLTFGNNGFRLKFQNSSALGDDTSGNGNDFTATSGWATHDQVPDSPTNNFCTYNSLDRNAFNNSFIAYGNLNVADYVSNAALTVAGTMAMRSGKWYFEILRTAAVNGGYWGIIREDKFAGQSSTGSTGTGSGDYAYYVQFNGSLIKNGSTTSSFLTAFSTDDVIQVAYDADTGKVWFGRNNTWGGSGDPANGTNEAGTVDSYSDYGYKVWTSVIGNAFSYEQATLNCGQDSTFVGQISAGGNADDNGIGDFKYAPPSGFLALCSANLPDPSIDPAKGEQPADHFNTVLYTGNNSTNNITGVGFQPDWVWVKNRNGTQNHYLQDSVRGASNYLVANNAGAENQYSGLGSSAFTSFDSDGFSVTSDSSIGMVNSSSSTYVAWNWLAGGSASSNSDGSITSSVSANTEAGFSIVGYTGNATAGATIGHGLSQAPEYVIFKNRSSGVNWLVQGDGFGSPASGNIILLNTTGSAYANSNFNTTLGASTITLDSGSNYNGSGHNIIAYCFHSVDGYQKIGSYTGNGSSTDGTFVYTGFRPAFVMIRRTDSSTNWIMFDTKRDTGNEVTQFLYPDLSNAEAAGSGVLDIVSNGFKLRNAGTSNRNASGGTYFYWAIAEQPFKFSNAR